MQTLEESCFTAVCSACVCFICFKWGSYVSLLRLGTHWEFCISAPGSCTPIPSSPLFTILLPPVIHLPFCFWEIAYCLCLMSMYYATFIFTVVWILDSSVHIPAHIHFGHLSILGFFSPGFIIFRFKMLPFAIFCSDTLTSFTSPLLKNILINRKHRK